jgi:hypothetical protein
MVVSNVVDFDLNKLPTQLFLCTDAPGGYAFSETISAKPAPEADSSLDKLYSPVEQNMTVSFLIPSSSSIPAAATFPFKVLSVKNFNGHTAYVGSFVMRNETVTVIPSLITSTIMPLDTSDLGEMQPLVNTEKAYYVPEGIKAVSLDSAISLDTVKSGQAKFIFKQASRRREKLAEVCRFGDTIKLKHCDFDEPLLGKLACATLGISRLHDRLMEKTSKEKQVFVALPEYETVRFKKHAFKSEAKKLKIDRTNFIKAAAGINDENMSMLNLSLGLSSSSDGFKFSEYIDLFKDAIDKLSRLLLASRMGMDMSDSAAIRLSVDSLDSIVQQLRTL